MYQRAFTFYEKARNRNYTATLHGVNNFGDLYKRHSKVKEAEEMYWLVQYQQARRGNLAHISIFLMVRKQFNTANTEW